VSDAVVWGRGSGGWRQLATQHALMAGDYAAVAPAFQQRFEGVSGAPGSSPLLQNVYLKLCRRPGPPPTHTGHAGDLTMEGVAAHRAAMGEYFFYSLVYVAVAATATAQRFGAPAGVMRTARLATTTALVGPPLPYLLLRLTAPWRTLGRRRRWAAGGARRCAAHCISPVRAGAAWAWAWAWVPQPVVAAVPAVGVLAPGGRGRFGLCTAARWRRCWRTCSRALIAAATPPLLGPGLLARRRRLRTARCPWPQGPVGQSLGLPAPPGGWAAHQKEQQQPVAAAAWRQRRDPGFFWPVCLGPCSSRRGRP
jgi:hypothetical protein